jgi:sulfotransferase family protein
MSAPQAYLILGGTTKAATSALFAHLAAHPRVSPARLKEPRFFLDPEYPLETAFPFARGLAAYESLFPPRAGAHVRLEATPDYLHSPGSAARIAATLPGARVAFALRDPIARLVSWYRFARAGGRLPRGLGFAEFVSAQQVTQAAGARREQPLLALAQGRYVEDLERYRAALGAERVHVLFQEELVSDPAPVLRALAEFAELDPAPLARPFALENPTRAQRSPALHRGYVRLGFRLRNACAAHPRLFAALRRAHGLVKPAYALANARAPEEVVLAPELRAELERFYAPSVRRLAEWLGRRPPWLGYGEGHGADEARRPSHA